jgi:subtilisin-like proprotein convertase family protein
MIRTVFTPQQATVHVSIPEQYIGKKVEMLLFTPDEVEVLPILKRENVAQYKGLLTAEEAAQYHRYLQTARVEWNRDI